MELLDLLVIFVPPGILIYLFIIIYLFQESYYIICIISAKNRANEAFLASHPHLI